MTKSLHLVAMFFFNMIDHFDHLIITNPIVRMKNDICNALLNKSRIDNCLHVVDSFGVLGLMQIVALPIVGNCNGKLPT